MLLITVTIFGLQIVDFGVLMRVTTLNTRPYVALRCHGCHLDNRYDGWSTGKM